MAEMKRDGGPAIKREIKMRGGCKTGPYLFLRGWQDVKLRFKALRHQTFSAAPRLGSELPGAIVKPARLGAQHNLYQVRLTDGLL
jgi:hypothetical protein